MGADRVDISPQTSAPAAGQRPLRILQAFQPPDGGVAVHVGLLSCGLIARGHEVVVSGPDDARCRADVEAAGGRYVALPWNASVPAPADDRAVWTALRELLRGGRFDIAHAHGQKAGMLARDAARRAGVTSAYTPHCFVYRTQFERPRRGQRLRFVVNRAVERRLGRATGVLLACSRDEAQAAVADGLVSADRARVVEYGVAPDRDGSASAALAALPGSGPLIGTVCTLRDQKGLEYLLEALARLARQRDPVRCVIVGEGPLRDALAAEIEHTGLGETTWLLPFGGSVEPYLQALDAFVLPSLWEGMPIAVLEAMAMGLPVVASAVNGTPEAVADGVTGLLVPARDPQALADAIQRLTGDAALREAMGAAGQRIALERFTIPRMVSESERGYYAAAGVSEPG